MQFDLNRIDDKYLSLISLITMIKENSIYNTLLCKEDMDFLVKTLLDNCTAKKINCIDVYTLLALYIGIIAKASKCDILCLFTDTKQEFKSKLYEKLATYNLDAYVPRFANEKIKFYYSNNSLLSIEPVTSHIKITKKSGKLLCPKVSTLIIIGGLTELASDAIYKSDLYDELLVCDEMLEVPTTPFEKSIIQVHTTDTFTTTSIGQIPIFTSGYIFPVHERVIT